MRTHLLHTIVLLTSISAAAQTASEFSSTPPPGAPSHVCKVTPASDPSALRIPTGAEPFPFVFQCGPSGAGNCVTQQLRPGSQDLPAGSVFQLGHEEAAWSCVSFGSIDGWMPSDRLAPPPSSPSYPASAWTGFYRQGKHVPGVEDNRLLIQPGKTPGTLHVSGRAFWYGGNDNVHLGAIDAADTAPLGPVLHAVDGTCVLDLVLDPATHTLSANDNMNCGGMNVRFWGSWHRFTPSTLHKK
jgi:hypothetical protein